SVAALRDVSFDLHRGDSVGIVGESGSGKTTLARIIAGLERPSQGTVHGDLGAGGPRRHRQSRVQYVFQDSTSSLNPHLRLGAIIGEFLPDSVVGRQAREDRAARLLAEVGLPAEYLRRYPRQLSGGQRQRVGIARALAAEPDLIVADEPVSALDVSVQATVINLLNRLRVTHGISYIVVSHDIGVVSFLCNKLIVINHGEVQETGPTERVLAAPRADYTRALLDAVPGARLEALPV
ncbi:MAG TPA: ABC transporter ATP-binding protein, partial [Pseudonocardiaceae bacterium]